MSMSKTDRTVSGLLSFCHGDSCLFVVAGKRTAKIMSTLFFTPNRRSALSFTDTMFHDYSQSLPLLGPSSMAPGGSA